MTNYTAAPACTMLATNCCVCNRPLLDAVSVQMGIGPECRKKYMGKGQGASEAARTEANQIVYQLALVISGVNYETAFGTREPMPTAVDQDATQAAYALGGPRAVGQMLAANTATGTTLLGRLVELGFDKLAAKMEAAWMPIRIEEVGGRLQLKAPYNEGAIAAQRSIPGRLWDKANKVNTFPATLTRFYAGLAGMGPKGAFVVPTNPVTAPTARMYNTTFSAEAINAQEDAREARKANHNRETELARELTFDARMGQ